MTIVDEIANSNNIKEVFFDGKKMDPEKRLFISDNYVIKIYYPKKFAYYYNELEVYKSLATSKYLPELFFYGENEKYKYIILSKIDGIALFDIWDQLSNSEREHYLKEIAVIIKKINNIKTDRSNFKKTMIEEFYNSTSKLNYSNYAIQYLKDIYRENIDNISVDEETSLIHIDTHFYNFMINKNNELIAYDFEHTIMAPKDYQLVRLYRMNYYPETFIYPKNSLSKNKIKNYSNILSVIIENYPQIINNKSEDRLKIYLVNYLLKEAIRCNINEEKTLKIIKDNKTIRLRSKI